MEIVNEFSKLPAANVADCMGRLCGMNPQIKLMSSPVKERMCGVALTVKVFFVKYFSLKKASEFPFFSKGFSLLSAGIMHPCA